MCGKKELRSLLAWWKSYRDDTRKKEAPDEKTEGVAIKTDGTQGTGDQLTAEEKELDEIDKQITEFEVSI